MVRRLVVLSVAWFAAAQPLTFEVASVKAARYDGSGNSTFNTHPASLEGTNNALAALIRFAYHLDPGELSGPAWIETQRFDIMAKASHEVKGDELRLMLQTLLAERFKLAVHQEEKQLPSYALVVDKGGLKIKPVEGNKRNMHGARNSLEATEAPLAQLAGNLAYLLGRPVYDETNTPGAFTYKLIWTPEETSAISPKTSPAEPTGPTIFEAIREQLGLKLEERKTPAQVVVVDHAERVPTEN